MNHFIPALLLLLAGAAPTAAHAQLYDPWHRPVDVDYREVHSPHFRVIYQSGLGDEAGEMAALLERALPEVRSAVGLRRRLSVPVVLNRFTDRGNGFVTSLPFRQEIEAVGLRGKTLSPRFHSWFETVAPHELVHAAHAESGHGFGIGWMLRLLGPDLARSLNLSAPRGINEGAAVWYESTFRPGAGRLNHSLFEMEFRAAMLSDDPWHLAQMLEPPSYTRPFDRYYHGGAHLFKYMVGLEGDLRFFRRARNFYYRFPLLGYGPALWYGTKTMPHVLGARVRRHFRDEAARVNSSLGKLTQPEIVATRRGTVHRRPIWIDAETLLIYASGYHLRPGFYRVDVASGRREALAYESLAEDFLYSLTHDSSAVLFTRYVPDVLEPLRSVADVFRLELATGHATRITEGGRTFAPVAAPDGRIWALRNVAQFNEWANVDAAGSVAGIATFDRSTIVSILPDPQGSRTVALVSVSGKQGVFEVQQRDGGYVLEPLIVFRDASVFDISWGAGGKYLLFSADYGGIANVYAWDSGSQQVYRLTNVPFGAIEPALSPDGSKLAFINYRHERYDLVQVPFRLKETDVLPTDALTKYIAAVERDQRPATVRQDSSRRYKPLSEIRPRVFYPYLLYQRPTGNDQDLHLGFGAGAGLEWSDPLQYWTAHTSAFYQKGTMWGRMLVRSGRFLVRPSVELFREPSTLIVRRTRGEDVDTLRVGRDERGVGLGLRLPAVFESNVFQTTAVASLAGEYRREKLFDDEGETLRAPDDLVTLRPSLQFGYRIQTNPRDVVPNSGLRVTSFSRVDLWSQRRQTSRYLQVQGEAYLPFLRASSTGLTVRGRLHVQNRGGIVDLSSFFPRGYETESVFLGQGAYGNLGFEITQPLWYIDDGFILLPLYFRALFAYAFVESMQPVSGFADEVRRAVVGGGLGLQARFGHGINVTLRIAPVYRFRERDWSVSFR